MNTSPRVDRRRAMAVMAASAAAASLQETQLVAEQRAASGWIDAHSHIWTRDIQKYPLKSTAKLADLDPPSFTTEELIKTSEAEGVDRVVLIAHHTYYGFDNTYMTDAARQHPKRFRVVGMVDDLKPNPDARMRELAEQHVSGFRITSWIRKEKWLDGPGMNAMWRCAAETGQAICCLMDAPYLPSLDKMCAKFPRTTVVVDHFARIGVDGKIASEDVDALCNLAKRPNTHLKVSAYYALGKKKPPYDDLIPMIRRVYTAFGPQRLMWASDSPYQLQKGNTYGDSIRLIRDRIDFLSKEDKEWLLRKTAEKVYFGKLNV